jgi:hypothetical protein
MLRAGLVAIPIATSGLPQRSVVVVYGIFGFEPFVVVGGGGDYCTEGQVAVRGKR